jgi:hypothetical protein
MDQAEYDRRLLEYKRALDGVILERAGLMDLGRR